MSLDDYEIREMEDHERPAILNFQTRHFFANEYTLKTFIAKNRMTEEEVRIMKEDFRMKFEVVLNEQPCVVAVHRETQTIVGINMLSIVQNPKLTVSADKPRSSTDDAPVRSKFLSDWFTYVLYAGSSSVDFFKEFPAISSALEILFLGVDSRHGRKGLATAMIRAAVDLARGRGIKLVYGMFSSPFSFRASKRLGFKTYNEIDIMSFWDSEGNVVYEGTGPYQIFITALELC